MTTKIKNLLESYTKWLDTDGKKCSDNLKKEQVKWALSEPSIDSYDEKGYPFPFYLEKIANPIFTKIGNASLSFRNENNGWEKRILCALQVPTILRILETSTLLIFNGLRLIRYTLITLYRLVIFIFGGFLKSGAREALYLALETLLKDIANQILIVVERLVFIIEHLLLSVYHTFKDDKNLNFSCIATLKTKNKFDEIRRLYNYKYPRTI